MESAESIVTKLFFLREIKSTFISILRDKLNSNNLNNARVVIPDLTK